MKKICLALTATLALGAAYVGDVCAQTARRMEAVDKMSFRMEAQEAVNQTQSQTQAQAQAQASPANLSNDASTESVEVMLDREDLIYTSGETAEITVRSSVSGYLYLVCYDVEGNATLLFPNKWNSDNYIQKNKTVTYPSADQNFLLRIVGPPFGKEKICAYVTSKEIEAIKGIELGKDATDITDILSEFSVELKKRVAKDKAGSKGIEVVEKRRELTVGQCVYHTQPRSSASGKPEVSATAPRRIFVGFGINKYDDKRIRDLTCCVADAKAMGEVACERLGVKEKDCLVITDEQVTLASVRRIFTEILPKCTHPGDQIFLYWSGHGDKASSGVTRANDSFLVPSDADVNDRSTMLDEHVFGEWLKNNLHGREIFLFLDACHSGGMLLGGGNSKSLTRDPDFVFDFGANVSPAASKSLGHVGMFAMASSGEDELSWEGSGSLGLSVATHYLIETLKEGDSSLTHKALVGEIRPLVDKYVKNNRPGATQTVKAYDGVAKPTKLIRR